MPPPLPASMKPSCGRVEVLRARDAGRGDGGRRVVRARRVVALDAEEAVDPAVLVRGEAHVVDVHRGVVQLRHHDGLRPEPEALRAVVALRDGEERLAVEALDARDDAVLAAEADRAGVEDRLDREPLEQHRVRGGVQVVAPLERDVEAREDGALVADERAAVVERAGVGFGEDLVLAGAERGEAGVEVHGGEDWVGGERSEV